MEYHGYLMSESHNHYRSQYLCVDRYLTPVSASAIDRKGIRSKQPDQPGLEFFPVEGKCGAIPCPPYEETKEFTCAVCTK